MGRGPLAAGVRDEVGVGDLIRRATAAIMAVVSFSTFGAQRSMIARAVRSLCRSCYLGKFMSLGGLRERRSAGASAETRSRFIPSGFAGGYVVRIAGLADCGVGGSVGASAPLLSR